ncbi:hypothetical protein PHYBLDRAFT_138818 [Phycomyces blakesleeanus NRRL 1555(-)]|uniref:Uncharacterized protein n=1 Tax=Phycomyces blakesleeanus (strain ATCC 8743b / DSM 1359 / FGSC 10004 / NBRC 33097 / NRRL 1555) TaxID=763407 RepID=A0A163ESG0_PHYB8|nr:hypothetical protein PHYBLDRAFT_138818 [Phycomyces blakesleeanus NRRL 1555(-)]OAD81270.1 hypothetical protein PHYBLDRAFT_138818 [Phycomyces blakesleeanus NRRL 1555(-)]|eukprot:XP_018299310.1 hypothetical protein PHYBLDRAFT_138818 [Phycomyces blakesleeanus NRRL 1555(-)]
MLDVSISIKGNELLPPTTFPLTKKPMLPMSTTDCKNDMTSSAFVNNQIEVIKSIEILGQVYKGCNGNGRGSYIQTLFEENSINACYGYVGEIQYIFVHSFTPTNSLTTLYNHNHQHIFAFVK